GAAFGPCRCGGGEAAPGEGPPAARGGNRWRRRERRKEGWRARPQARTRVPRAAAPPSAVLRLAQRQTCAPSPSPPHLRSSRRILSAVRSDSAAMVSVGFAVPVVGNVPLPTRNRFL